MALPWTESLRVRFELSDNRTSLDRDAFLGAAGVPASVGVELEGGEVYTFRTLAVLQWLFPVGGGGARPYILFGSGYGRIGGRDLTIRLPGGSETIDGSGKNGIAGAAGLGVEFPLRSAKLFVDGRYAVRFDFGDPPDFDNSYIPLKVGGSFTP